MKIVQSLADQQKQTLLLEKFKHIMVSGQYAEGVYCSEATQQLAGMLQRSTCLFNSCGSALYTMFVYYRMLGYSQVFVQNNTFYATAAMAREAGLIPMLIDSGPECPSMSAYSLEQAGECVTSLENTLVVLTHVGGWLAKDYDVIAWWCQKNRVPLVEDCAHAFGVPGAGTKGVAACWSFYPTKALPIGEGGALSTTSQELYDFAEKFRQYGKYVVKDVIQYARGMNLRMSEWNAAVLCVQLNLWSKTLQARLRDAEKLQSIAPCLLTGASNYYKYPVAVEQAVGLKTVGKVYSRSDQLDRSLSRLVRGIVALPNSHAWANSHACLPIGEGLYDQSTEAEVKALLTE